MKKNKRIGELIRGMLLVFMAAVLLICCTVGIVGAAPANWIRSDDGLPASASSFDPAIFLFGSDVYCFAVDGLYAQLYNQPCFGWQKVEIPSGVNYPVPVGDYLFATGMCPDLWWIKKGDAFIIENWKKVTSNGLPGCDPNLLKTAVITPMVIFNGQIYGDRTYYKSYSSSHTTFDIYRSPDIGQTTMTWSKVVAEGFGDPQNHVLGYLGIYKNKLIAVTTGTYDGLFGDTDRYLQGIEVWESSTGNSGSWTQVNKDGFGTIASEGIPPTNIRVNCAFGAAEEYNGYLYIGTKSHFGAEIWRYDGSGNTGGWTNVTPDTLGVPTPVGAGRVEDMVVFENKLYVAEGYPTANLSKYDGANWTVVEKGVNPFDPLNASITGLAVLPSKPIPPVGGSGSTGDKLFLLTDIMGGEYQVWSYPLPYTLLTCTALKQATISVSPKTATNELGPGKTHTVIATVNAGSGADIYDLWVNCSVEVEQANGSGKVLGFIGADGLFGFTYKAIQDPAGLYTDTITACFFNSETKVCDKATKTWVDTTPPTIVIISPQDGGKYTLNAVVTANYSVEDAVGVAWITASVPIGGPIPTSQMGNQVFTVTATDHGGNTATKSVTYQVLAPPVAQAGPDQTVLVGLPVALNGSGSHDPDGSIVAHAWNFGDGTSGTGVKPSHAYSSAGLKTVTLTVTDNDGL